LRQNFGLALLVPLLAFGMRPLEKTCGLSAKDAITHFATPPLLASNARSKRRRPKTFELAQKPRAGVRLTELLGGGAHLLATPPDEVKMPEPQVL
jgi:hypothetical protein